MNLSSDEWTSALKVVFARASADADFRMDCLTNPAAAVKKAAGVELPVGVRFTEDAAEQQAICLPPFGQDPDEITESELLNLAGGQIIPTVTDCH